MTYSPEPLGDYCHLPAGTVVLTYRLAGVEAWRQEALLALTPAYNYLPTTQHACLLYTYIGRLPGGRRTLLFDFSPATCSPLNSYHLPSPFSIL